MGTQEIQKESVNKPHTHTSRFYTCSNKQVKKIYLKDNIDNSITNMKYLGVGLKGDIHGLYGENDKIS